MSHATDQVRSTREDARGFADAFSAADDAFTAASGPGESRELSLDELADVIALPARANRAPVKAPPEPTRRHALTPRSEDQLLTLDELGDALLRPAAREADVLDFDFGTSAHERARRRTAARLGGQTARRVSGPGPARASSDVRLAEVRDSPADQTSSPAPAASRQAATASRQAPTAPRQAATASRSAAAASRRAATAASRAAMADAAAAAAERLAVRSPDDVSASPVGRRTVEVTGRLEVTSTASHVREGRHARPRGAADRFAANPDRIAMWAVLLGIVLVLIAFTSGSAGAVALPVLAGL